MVSRFCLYSVLKNLRLSAPFLAIYLLECGFAYAEIGALLGFEHLVMTLLEVPSGLCADRMGRRRALAFSFACHAFGLSILAIGADGSATSFDTYLVGLGIYGVGEAFRTGSHKAMILDYLEINHQAEATTRVLSLTRTFSKASSALAGLVAGGLLFWLHDFAVLCWFSATFAVIGCTLILTYPAYIEGECRRQRPQSDNSLEPTFHQLKAMFQNHKMWSLTLCSVIYESQVKIVLKFLLQPFLYQGLASFGLQIGARSIPTGNHSFGSLMVGINELLRDTCGAFGASKSHRFERHFANRDDALLLIYRSTTLTTIGLAATAFHPGTLLPVGVLAIGGITFLQNLRRPIFVSRLNELVEKPWRATTLSVESQARSLAVAIQLPAMGLAADAWGLWSVAALSSVILIVGASSNRTTRRDAIDN